MRRTFYFLSLGVAFLATGAWLWITLVPRTVRFDLPPAAILHDSGQAFLTKVPTPHGRGVTLTTDRNAGAGGPSQLRVLENGRPLGPPHTLHEEIRQDGHGRFSHWRGMLYFSSSDGSDPRTNGRTYAIEDEVAPSAWLGWLSAASILLACFAYRSAVQTPGRIARAGTAVLSSLLRARDMRVPVQTALLAFAAIAAGVWLTVYAWSTGAGLSFAIGSWFPISDAEGWWSCGKDIEYARAVPNFFPSEWCQRRPIYPSLLASLSVVVRDDSMWLVLAQSILLATTATLVVREAIRLTGILGGAIAGALIFAYMSQVSLGQFMSEAAGLAFGLTGVALLLRGAETMRFSAVVLGTAALSLGLTARLGPLFVLPILIVWSGFAARAWHLSLWRSIGIVAAACLAGLVVQAFLLLATGGHLGNTGDNFSYTFYGLATGGKGWMAVLQDHPEVANVSDAETARQIYALAWAAFQAHPMLLLDGLSAGYQAWQQSLFDDLPVALRDPCCSVLLPAGLVTLVWRWRDQRLRLLGSLFLGEALSAPWIGTDGGGRVFAATEAADVLIAVLGLQSIALCIAALLRRPFATTVLAAPSGFMRFPVWTLSVLLLLVFAPIVRMPRFLLHQAVEPPSCGAGLTPYALDLGRNFLLQKSPAGGRFEAMAVLPADRMTATARAGTWWAEDLSNLPENAALIKFTRSPLGLRSGGGQLLLWSDAPPLHRTDRVLLCVSEKPAGKLARQPYHLVVNGTIDGLP
ncbi:MAG TPA: hypothetical protein VKS60_22045 [Stellaceae bacterium]|nr:hypothetical protein [Stellaceae bacterium]